MNALRRAIVSLPCAVLLGGLGLSTGAVAGPSPHFVACTAEAGLDYVQQTVPPPQGCIFSDAFCEPDRMTGGSAVADVDGNGHPDLYVTVLDGPDVLYLNQGDGSFVDGTAAAGLAAYDLQSNGAAFGDIDNDGDPDLYVTVMGLAADPANSRFYLFINDGSGVFAEAAEERGVAVPSAFNRQGYSVALGDYDRDGWLDLHTTEWLSPTGLTHARLLRNLGPASPGHFEDVTESAAVDLIGVYGFASAFHDLDHDGWPDLVVAADFGTGRLFWNNGDGTFTDGTTEAGVGTDENGMGSTVGDFDGDGDLDWFVSSIFDPDQTCEVTGCGWGYSGNRLYRNEGGRQFSDATDLAGVRNGHWGWGAAFLDHDNDGDLDLVMTNGVDFPNVDEDLPFNADPMRFWENDGTGGMTEVSEEVGVTDTGSGKGLVVLDHDGDGDLDLFVVNNASQPVLYRNDGGNANDWLRVETVGSLSNRDGIGARITVQSNADGPMQVREIGSVSHFLGQSELAAHFGLGAGSSAVSSVRIEWPSGKIQLFQDVARNSTLVAEEADCVDADADGFCVGADCDDGDDGVFPGATESNDGVDNQCPGEPGHGLIDEPVGPAGFFDPEQKQVFCWPAQPGATAYEARRSSNESMGSPCAGIETSGLCWVDPELPSTGQAYFYLHRPSAPFPGSWGVRSDGSERLAVCAP